MNSTPTTAAAAEKTSATTKENLMKSILFSLLTGSLLLSAAMAGETSPSTGAGAKDVPYGHKDFVPTSERPVYFRQTSGDYPGATPPLEWWEGTPTTKKVKGTFGNPPQYKEGEVLDFADTNARNIRWKMPVPGWSLSHPIVVGKRVFAVGEPDFVTCWDLDTGKQLWQRRIMPLLCDGLPEDKAAAGQKVLDLARAFSYGVCSVGYGVYSAGNQNLFQGWNRDGTPKNSDHAAFVAGKKAMAQKLLDAFTPHRPEVEAFGNAALLAALDKDLEILRRYQTVADLEALKALANEKMPGSHDPLRPVNLIRACLQVLGVDIGGQWWGYVGSADSTLASDGQRILGVFDQGQVFCLDLEGKTVWLQREKGHHDNRGSFHRSPLLCNDLLLVRSLTHKGSIRPLRALDVKTGQVRWESPLAGSNYTVPRLMKIPGADGKPVDVLIGDAPQSKDQGLAVVRVRDGKLLGYLPYQDCGRGALMAVLDQQVTWTSTSDTGGGPTCSYHLRLDGPDRVVIEKVFVLGETEKKDRIFYNQHDFPTVAGNAWLYRNQLFDATTGSLLAKLPVRISEDQQCAVVAGHHLIALAGGDNDPYARKRDDRMASNGFVVIDIADPAKPVVVAKNNLLGYKEPAADIIVSTYFKAFDPFDFAGCYKYSASYFAMMAGPVPVGNKLLIQSSAFLYCIGEK